MKYKKFKKLLLLILLLFITITMLSTTSYAWFTANRTVSVTTLNVHVRSEGGIEISADGTTWKSVLSLQDLIDAKTNLYPDSVNQIPNYLAPVSTGGELDTNGFLRMYYGVTDNNTLGDFILTSTRSTETSSNGDTSTGNFIAFDIFIKTSSTKEIYLATNSGATYFGDTSYGIENAVRIAFVKEGNVAIGSALNTIQALTTSNNSNVYIWEPNYNTHTVSGVNNAQTVYDLTIDGANSDPVPYDGVINNITKADGITLGDALATTHPTMFKNVNINYYTKTNFTTNHQIFNMEEGITKIRVYMWLEGQDVDCENDASIGDLTFNLQMTTDIS